MEGLKESEASVTVQIHPSKSNSVSDALLGELSSLLFTYNQTFEGVILAYDPFDSSPLAKVLPGIHPFLGVTLKVRLLLFDPKPDMLIEGEVVKITRNSIHVVVLGFSSALIAGEDIRDEFKFKCKDGEEGFYVSKFSKKHKICVGSVVRFVVKVFDTEVLHFSGALVGASTGCVKWLEKNVGKWDGAESSDFKRKLVKGENDGQIVVTNSNSKKKRKVKQERD